MQITDPSQNQNVSRTAPHSEICTILGDAIDLLEHLAQKYETIYEQQQTTLLNNSDFNNIKLSDESFDESEVTSYKLNNIYYLIDLINDSPWRNPKHKLHSGNFSWVK